MMNSSSRTNKPHSSNCCCATCFDARPQSFSSRRMVHFESQRPQPLRLNQSQVPYIHQATPYPAAMAATPTPTGQAHNGQCLSTAASQDYPLDHSAREMHANTDQPEVGGRAHSPPPRYASVDVPRPGDLPFPTSAETSLFPDMPPSATAVSDDLSHPPQTSLSLSITELSLAEHGVLQRGTSEPSSNQHCHTTSEEAESLTGEAQSLQKIFTQLESEAALLIERAEAHQEPAQATTIPVSPICIASLRYAQAQRAFEAVRLDIQEHKEALVQLMQLLHTLLSRCDAFRIRTHPAALPAALEHEVASLMSTYDRMLIPTLDGSHSAGTADST